MMDAINRKDGGSDAGKVGCTARQTEEGEGKCEEKKLEVRDGPIGWGPAGTKGRQQMGEKLQM